MPMNKIVYAFVFASFVSCLSTTMSEDSKTAAAGWIDDDTYTVTVDEINEKKAIEQAKYQILKDIVNVRVKNNSRYTDIIKIREEFETPLLNGKIISKKNIPGGIQIYFQIRDTGLRQKFQRK